MNVLPILIGEAETLIRCWYYGRVALFRISTAIFVESTFNGSPLYEPYECITYVVLDWENETEGYDVFDYLNEIGSKFALCLIFLCVFGFLIKLAE
jgi:hypothetical protein